MLFDTSFGMTKAERLDYGQSLMTHAMVFQGVNLDENGAPNRWRVENSWGEDCGDKGYFVMTDRWFDEYTYQVVVNRRYLPKEALEAYDSGSDGIAGITGDRARQGGQCFSKYMDTGRRQRFCLACGFGMQTVRDAGWAGQRSSTA